ncbi:MAG: PHP domain-containing protein [Promethearchaeota archaeon]
MTAFIDLHIHTTASDGSDSPFQVVEKAHLLGLQAIGITDHDTVHGVAEALEAGSRIGIEVVPGVEISCQWKRRSIHLLGYYFDLENPGISRLLEGMRRGRTQRLPKMLAKLRQLGIDIDRKEVEAEAKGEAIGRPHLAQIMVRRGYVSSFEEAFEKYLGYGRPAYAQRPRPTIAEGVQTILDAEGLPIIAHPLTIDAPIREVLQDICPMGLQGVEHLYPYQYLSGRSQEWYDSVPRRLAHLKQLAEQYDLVLSGGSDYHGTIEGKAPLGSAQVPYEILQGLQDRYQDLFGHLPNSA